MNVNEQQNRSNSDQTRDRLLSSGLNLLAKKGYRGAVTREIAMEAGVTEMTLYRHFRSKDELFITAVVQNAEQLLSLFIEPSGNLRADLLLLYTSIVKQLLSNSLLIIRIIPELAEHSELKEAMDSIQDRLKTKLLSLINHYESSSALANYSDALVYYMFMGPIFLFSLDAQNSDSAFDSQQHVRFFLLGCGLKTE